jgi:PKD repeat protein
MYRSIRMGTSIRVPVPAISALTFNASATGAMPGTIAEKLTLRATFFASLGDIYYFPSGNHDNAVDDSPSYLDTSPHTFHISQNGLVAENEWSATIFDVVCRVHFEGSVNVIAKYVDLYGHETHRTVASGSSNKVDRGVCLPPTVTVSPTSRTVTAGTAFTITGTVAAGSGTIQSEVWTRDNDEVGRDSAKTNPSFTMALQPGTYTLTLTATNSAKYSASATSQITVVANDECDQTGGGAVTSIGVLAPQHLSGVQGTLAVRSLSVTSTCGEETGSPGSGSGGPPIEDPGPTCHWVRYYVIYDDFSWDWISGWERECDETLLGGGTSAISVRSFTSLSAGQADKFRVQLVGTDTLQNARAVSIRRERNTGVDVVIGVDLRRATAADLEQALLAAQTLASRQPFAGQKVPSGAVVSAATAAARAKNGPDSRAARYLNDLFNAPVLESKPFGVGHSLVLEVDRHTIRLVSDPK